MWQEIHIATVTQFLHKCPVFSDCILLVFPFVVVLFCFFFFFSGKYTVSHLPFLWWTKFPKVGLCDANTRVACNQNRNVCAVITFWDFCWLLYQGHVALCDEQWENFVQGSNARQHHLIIFTLQQKHFLFDLAKRSNLVSHLDIHNVSPKHTVQLHLLSPIISTAPQQQTEIFKKPKT